MREAAKLLERKGRCSPTGKKATSNTSLRSSEN
jgi:hypothetical protein